MLVFVAAVGILYAGLLGQDAASFAHFVAVGLVAWQFFSATIAESSSALISGRDMVLNTKVDPLVLVFRTIARNLIIMLHTLPILLLTGFFAWPDIGLNVPLFFVGLFLLAVNAGWIAVILAISSARFRDIPPMITAIMQLLFICSPIIWTSDVLPEKTIFVTGNPLAYFINAVRDPLLAKPSYPTSCLVSGMFALVGCLFALLMYRRFRNRIAYWV